MSVFEEAKSTRRLTFLASLIVFALLIKLTISYDFRSELYVKKYLSDDLTGLYIWTLTKSSKNSFLKFVELPNISLDPSSRIQNLVSLFLMSNISDTDLFEAGLLFRKSNQTDEISPALIVAGRNASILKTVFQNLVEKLKQSGTKVYPDPKNGQTVHFRFGLNYNFSYLMLDGKNLVYSFEDPSGWGTNINEPEQSWIEKYEIDYLASSLSEVGLFRPEIISELIDNPESESLLEEIKATRMIILGANKSGDRFLKLVGSQESTAKDLVDQFSMLTVTNIKSTKDLILNIDLSSDFAKLLLNFALISHSELENPKNIQNFLESFPPIESISLEGRLGNSEIQPLLFIKSKYSENFEYAFRNFLQAGVKEYIGIEPDLSFKKFNQIEIGAFNLRDLAAIYFSSRPDGMLISYSKDLLLANYKNVFNLNRNELLHISINSALFKEHYAQLKSWPMLTFLPNNIKTISSWLEGTSLDLNILRDPSGTLACLSNIK